MRTTKLSDIKRNVHELDLSGQILGRIATKIALLLVGKSKPYFTRHLDCGDTVIVKNFDKIKVTGKKADQKVYTRYSGYPGGLRKTPLAKMDPREVVRRAVWGMLPKNKLRKIWISRLKFA